MRRSYYPISLNYKNDPVRARGLIKLTGVLHQLLLSYRPVGSFLTRGYNRLFSYGLWSEMRTNSV